LKPEGGFGGESFTPPSAPVTRAILALCVLVQLAATIGGAHFGAVMARHAALIPGRVTGRLASLPGDVPAVLTPLTSLFVHAGWLHLTLNLVFLLWVGRNVEIVVGRARFILLFLVSGVAGALFEVAGAPGSAEQVIGASGAIAGVFGAYAMLFARQRARPRRVLGLTLGSAVLTALWFAASWTGLQLLTAAAFNTGEGGIAVLSHIGGFLAGLALARPLARRGLR